MSASPQKSPYRSGFATGVGVVLLAALVMALADLVHTGGGVGFAPALFALWALIASPIALGTGIVLGAGNATWGDGWVRGVFRRLREDAALDKKIAAILIAAAVLAGALVLVIGKLAVGLVGDVERKSVGGLLLGVVVVGAFPIVALGAVPLYRITHRIAAFVPAIGPLSRVVLLVIGASCAGVLAGLYVVFTKLDYQALNLGSLFAPALLPIVAVTIAILAYGPLAKVRERIPARAAIAGAGLVLAAALPVLALGNPSTETRTAITDRSYIGARMIGILRKLVDKDKDGSSAFFGGPDCDDHNAEVYPGHDEIPNNGIDDNCMGGDKAETAAPIDAGVGSNPPPTDAGAAPATTGIGGKNVVVIFVDTLRYDRLGFTGYQRDGKGLTPRIDAFAKESTVFAKAFAQAPNTPRSVPSFMASRYPSQIKYDKVYKSYGTVLDDNELLFEVLKPAGFTTLGMSSHFYFCDRTRYPATCPKVPAWMNSNVWQGTDAWDNEGALQIHKEGEPNSNNDSAGPRIVAKTVAKLEELAKADTKFAMMVHLFEPHSTYMTHPEFPITGSGELRPVKYDYEIAKTDMHVGSLLDALDRLGLANTTTVILMSDHGEAFGVHRFAGQEMWYHGQTLYQELLHVPVIVRVPNGTGRIANDVVELIDLAPTIAALFGVPPANSWRGRSLVPAIDGNPLPPKPAYAELLPEPKWIHDAKSMITADGTRHVFYRISDSAWEIYDLVADPDERKNIADSDPNANKLQDEITSWIEGVAPIGGPFR